MAELCEIVPESPIRPSEANAVARVSKRVGQCEFEKPLQQFSATELRAPEFAHLARRLTFHPQSTPFQPVSSR